MGMLASIRNAVVYARPFGIPEAESLMNFSPLGSLRCHCEPTDAAEASNDRRRSCRACGNAIMPVEPTRLYERLSKAEIRRVTTRMRRAGMDARHVELATRLTSLAGLDQVESISELGA